jgi:hypothetical protein
MVFTPIGARCPECVKVQNLPQYKVSWFLLVRAVGAVLCVGMMVGLGMAAIDRIPVLLWGIMWLVQPAGIVLAGYLSGEAVSRATRYKKGRLLQGIAISGVFIAVAVLILLTPGFYVGFYTLIGFIAALALAVNPLR